MASIRKRKDSAGRISGWQAQVRIRGCKPLTQTFKTQADARQWVAEREGELRKGTFVDTSSLKSATLHDLLERYLAEVSPRRKGGDVERYRLKALMREPMASLTLDRLGTPNIQKWRDARERVVKGDTVRREMSLLCSVLKRARTEWHYPLSDLMQGLDRPKQSDGRQRRPTWSELRKLLRELGSRLRDDGYLTGARNPWVRPAAMLALRTAMRQGEILATRWEWVDFEARCIRLPDTKNSTARDVPLSRKAELILRRLADGEMAGFVFRTNRSALKQVFRRATERAGIRNLRFHDFRHEATTRIATRLRNVLELSAVTGHKDPRMLKRYYNPDAKYLASMLD